MPTLHASTALLRRCDTAHSSAASAHRGSRTPRTVREGTSAQWVHGHWGEERPPADARSQRVVAELVWETASLPADTNRFRQPRRCAAGDLRPDVSGQPLSAPRPTPHGTFCRCGCSCVCGVGGDVAASVRQPANRAGTAQVPRTNGRPRGAAFTVALIASSGCSGSNQDAAGYAMRDVSAATRQRPGCCASSCVADCPDRVHALVRPQPAPLSAGCA